jgi:hypothetical protein
MAINVRETSSKTNKIINWVFLKSSEIYVKCGWPDSLVVHPFLVVKRKKIMVMLMDYSFKYLYELVLKTTFPMI